MAWDIKIAEIRKSQHVRGRFLHLSYIYRDSEAQQARSELVV